MYWGRICDSTCCKRLNLLLAGRQPVSWIVFGSFLRRVKLLPVWCLLSSRADSLSHLYTASSLLTGPWLHPRATHWIPALPASTFPPLAVPDPRLLPAPALSPALALKPSGKPAADSPCLLSTVGLSESTGPRECGAQWHGGPHCGALADEQSG